MRSKLDWRLLCPGPMADAPPVGVDRLRISQENLPVQLPGLMARLPDWLALVLFAKRMPEMIVSYADAAALMLRHLTPQVISRASALVWPCPQACGVTKATVGCAGDAKKQSVTRSQLSHFKETPCPKRTRFAFGTTAPR